MLNNLPTSKRAPAFALFISLGAWITLFVLLASPSDPKNALLFGYSRILLLLIVGVLTLALAPLYLTWRLLRQPEQSQRLWHSLAQREGSRNITLGISVLLFFLLWFALFLPDYRIGSLASYIARLHPILVWLTITSGVTILILLLERQQERLSKIISENKTALWVGLASLTLMVIIAVIIITTGVGIRNPEDYWYGGGVPVLGLQLLSAVVLGMFTAWIESRWAGRNQRGVDALLFIGLFLLAAFLWAREPLRPNFFLPDTAKNPIYPYSDSALFDTGSQYALIGQGLFNGQYFDRALYSAFLAYLHLFFGQDMERLMMIQAVMFAIFPAIIFLLGRELHSRALGLAAGFLTALRGVNSIVAALWIDLAGPKMMLTDFPTAIGTALFLLFVLKWVKKPAGIHYAVWAGGMLGLTLMLRTHVLLLLPALLAYVLIFNMGIRWNYRLIGSLALIVGMVSATFPWDLRNQALGFPPFYMYYARILYVIRDRYGIQSDLFLPRFPIESETSAAHSRGFAGTSRERVTRLEGEITCTAYPCKIANHFLHNLMTSANFMPSSFRFDDLWNVVKENAPYWQADWTGGGVEPGENVFLFINLALVAFGIGLAWEQKKWLGLLPLAIFLAYQLTNAVALTSGGRYVAPVDWVVILYYLMGILQIGVWLFRWSGWVPATETIAEETAGPSASKFWPYMRAMPAIAILFAIGMSLPAAEQISQPRYSLRANEEIITTLEERGLLEQAGLTREEVNIFLAMPNAMLIEGKAIYPRYYRIGLGEPDRSTYYRPLDYSRLVFSIIGPYSVIEQGVVIPGERPNFAIHNMDVVVMGCYNTSYYAPFIDSVVVFILNDSGYIYTRAPESPLQCPLQTP